MIQIVKSKTKEDYLEELRRLFQNDDLRDKSVLIKINLARVPSSGHPRTDSEILSNTIEFFLHHGCACTIAESAGGYLLENLHHIGLEELLEHSKVKAMDLDLEDVDKVSIEDQEHYIPKCFKNYDIRIGMPATSKRPKMVFSNNIKLFIGAVPRKYYQIDEPTTWRPQIHQDLHKSIACVFRAIESYSPFHYYINGGKAMDERYGEFELNGIFLGDNALELDEYMTDAVFQIEKPEYLTRVKGKIDDSGANVKLP